jgi:hypothetical protein
VKIECHGPQLSMNLAVSQPPRAQTLMVMSFAPFFSSLADATHTDVTTTLCSYRHVHLPSSNCVTVAEGLPLQFYARNHGRTQLLAAAHKISDISQLRGRGAAAVLAVVVGALVWSPH